MTTLLKKKQKFFQNFLKIEKIVSKFNENLDSPMKNFPEEIFGSRSWNFKIIIIRDEKFPQDEKNVEDDHKSNIEQKPWENQTDKKKSKKKKLSSF